MANLVAMNMKRKDFEVDNHGLSILLEPKRIKLQDDEIMEMMEEQKPLTDAAAAAANVPSMASWLPSKNQEAVHGMEDTALGDKSSKQPVRENQAVESPMDVEEDAGQCQQQIQPCRNAPFWSGFF